MPGQRKEGSRRRGGEEQSVGVCRCGQELTGSESSMSWVLKVLNER